MVSVPNTIVRTSKIIQKKRNINVPFDLHKKHIVMITNKCDNQMLGWIKENP